VTIPDGWAECLTGWGAIADPTLEDIGVTPRGTRRYYPAIGGSFEGPRLRGEVLPGRGNWLLTRPDRVLEAVGVGERLPPNMVCYSIFEIL
jgi:Protein of unknown function (DUF3237)